MFNIYTNDKLQNEYNKKLKEDEKERKLKIKHDSKDNLNKIN